MNLPYLKFYVRDWISDPQLRMVSMAARGFWLECLCLMHMAARRGYMETPSGKPINDEQLARLTGTFIGEVNQLKSKLLEHGIPSVDEKTGTWYCRRMINESRKSAKCSKAGISGGGSPLLRKKRPKTKDHIPDTRDHISIKDTFKGSYGEFGKVKLTEDQHGKLKAMYDSQLELAVEILDTYIESTGKRYSSHYAVMKKEGWVYQRIQDGKASTHGQANQYKTHDTSGNRADEERRRRADREYPEPDLPLPIIR